MGISWFSWCVTPWNQEEEQGESTVLQISTVTCGASGRFLWLLKLPCFSCSAAFEFLCFQSSPPEAEVEPWAPAQTAGQDWRLRCGSCTTSSKSCVTSSSSLLWVCLRPLSKSEGTGLLPRALILVNKWFNPVCASISHPPGESGRVPCSTGLARSFLSHLWSAEQGVEHCKHL